MLKELEKKLSRLEKLVAERIQENKICNCKAKSHKVLSPEFLDKVLIQRLVNPKVGGLAYVKLLELAYRRTGDIQPSRNQFNNQNNNAAGAFARQTTYQVVKPTSQQEIEYNMKLRARAELAQENGQS